MLLSRNKFTSDLPCAALQALRIGLEHSYDSNSRDIAGVYLKEWETRAIVGVGREEWETLVPATTTWLSIAGKTIYEHCQEDNLYDGWEFGTWSLQRWNLWKEQLGRFAKREDFTDECRALAAQTVRKMAEVEFSVSVQNFTQEVYKNTDDPCHFEAADALALLLKGGADADDTARSITTIYEIELRKYESTTMDDEKQVCYFWACHMCGAIRTFGSQELRERLFDLLVAISKQPDVKTPNGSVKKYLDCDVYWRDFPGWALIFAELVSGKLVRVHSFNAFADVPIPDYDGPELWRPGWKDDYIGQATKFLNATSFAAMLLEKDAFTIGLPAVASYALKRGIEQLYSVHEYDTDGCEIDIDSVKAEVLLPATASWLLIAGKVIYSHCLKNEIARYADPNARQGWGGGTWTLRRWDFWQEQLHDFADRDDLNQECRDVVMKTLKKMTEVEAEHDAG